MKPRSLGRLDADYRGPQLLLLSFPFGKGWWGMGDGGERVFHIDLEFEERLLEVRH